MRRAIVGGPARSADDVYRFYNTEPQCGLCRADIETLLATAAPAGATTTPAEASETPRRRPRAFVPPAESIPSGGAARRDA